MVPLDELLCDQKEDHEKEGDDEEGDHGKEDDWETLGSAQGLPQRPPPRHQTWSSGASPSQAAPVALWEPLSPQISAHPSSIFFSSAFATFEDAGDAFEACCLTTIDALGPGLAWQGHVAALHVNKSVSSRMSFTEQLESIQ